MFLVQKDHHTWLLVISSNGEPCMDVLSEKGHLLMNVFSA